MNSTDRLQSIKHLLTQLTYIRQGFALSQKGKYRRRTKRRSTWELLPKLASRHALSREAAHVLTARFGLASCDHRDRMYPLNERLRQRDVPCVCVCVCNWDTCWRWRTLQLQGKSANLLPFLPLSQLSWDGISKSCWICSFVFFFWFVHIPGFPCGYNPESWDTNHKACTYPSRCYSFADYRRGLGASCFLRFICVCVPLYQTKHWESLPSCVVHCFWTVCIFWQWAVNR